LAGHKVLSAKGNRQQWGGEELGISLTFKSGPANVGPQKLLPIKIVIYHFPLSLPFWSSRSPILPNDDSRELNFLAQAQFRASSL
jgi:hypothetical protein